MSRPSSTVEVTPPSPARGPIRAVVFDLDGVIVDSSAVMREAFSIAYAEVVGDGPAPFEEYNRHMGRYFPDIMRLMGLPLEMEGPFVRESYRMAHLVPLFPGVRETLETLHSRGIRMGIATGKAGPRARSLLDQLGVLGLFGQVIGSDEVARPKPAPDIVLQALGNLDVPPHEAMMVGDAVIDLLSGRNAGATAVATTWHGGDIAALLAAGPDLVVHAPAELLAHCPAALVH
ncbi:MULTISPECIES: HAD-IA family hydrolase [unclassified Micromonospora]|uniref:HAD-IA family hydrolase n=1 Tax=unclassified Micromonospora TaxID=2617518 RepID=UPI0003EEA853|nr:MULTISPECIES: HAD-IA family hydrolase [unclassified Micromonospora]EWM68883.1 AHBA synthesis associated protein [Micromonospora sp. M42]MCK1804939.1 HAD-IA family hydrolase [Micromonospora sp. R42106]MCK1834823.1 HAD-IA family hydrolase [Micromonospora sp. R42003]MCK1845402.1 HAD-IA family hydrolase [Micromonospora sp. R42004]MCM1018894.1 HAD-IA family hydrolase [Micromonospora sp. XM-20-01]